MSKSSEMFDALVKRIQETNDMDDVKRIRIEPRDGDLIAVVTDGSNVSLYTVFDGSTNCQYVWLCDDMKRMVGTEAAGEGEHDC